MKTISREAEQIRQTVKEAYAEAATRSESCAVSCCAGVSSVREQAKRIGYADAELDTVPEGANLGLGCGNPTALASLQRGEVVLDLGSGGGLDAFLAAEKVGSSGRVIGVDMTPEMVERATKAAAASGLSGHVEFRQGIIEQLPVASDSVDVVLSNCVINLSPDKPRVFGEAYRVLKSGGRLAVSDILLSEPLPQDIATLASAYVGCVGGAQVADVYLASMADAGFVDIQFERVPAAAMIEGALVDPTMKAVVEGVGLERVRALAGTVFSYAIQGSKP